MYSQKNKLIYNSPYPLSSSQNAHKALKFTRFRYFISADTRFFPEPILFYFPKPLPPSPTFFPRLPRVSEPTDFVSETLLLFRVTQVFFSTDIRPTFSEILPSLAEDFPIFSHASEFYRNFNIFQLSLPTVLAFDK